MMPRTSEKPYDACLDSPWGPMALAASEAGLVKVHFVRESAQQGLAPAAEAGAPILRDAARQLTAYFEGRLQDFELPLAPEGTPFQQAVWSLLMEIPYGESTTYGALADRLNLSNGARAVGAANGQNPLAIIVPCHRVIGSNGKLTGYAGGVHIKEALLAHERRHGPAPGQQTLC